MHLIVKKGNSERKATCEHAVFILLFIENFGNINPLPDDTILDRSKSKKFADDILKGHFKMEIKCHIG